MNRLFKLQNNQNFGWFGLVISSQIEGNCQLIQIGGLLDSKGYGIALTPGDY